MLIKPLNSTEDSSNPAGELNLAIAGNADAMNATPLTNNSMALSWTPSDNPGQYKIYSDMGSGYGVYVYKARPAQPAYIDKHLRQSTAYNYRVTQVSSKQETIVAKVNANTFVKAVLEADSVPSQLEVSTASIVAAPTALPPDAVLLGLVSDNNFTDEFKTLAIVGEVRNDSNLDVGETDITITFYDAAGSIISTATGETMLDIIPPGGKSPFIITLTRPAGLASHSLRAVGRSVPPPKQSAQLSSTELRRFEDDAGFFHIKGAIENVGSTVARRVKIAAVIYAHNNQVINVGFTYADPPILKPGEVAGYDIIFAYYPRYVTQLVIPFEE